MSTKFFTNKYDNLQRLKQAQFFSTVGTTTTANTHNETVNYDKNGNITTLQRTGYYVTSPTSTPPNTLVWDEWLDNLTYTYQGNKLNNVSDAGNKTAGVLDPATGALDYSYDNNGNLTKDNNKGITTITYNHLNLPLTITFSASKSINFVYDAAGTKLSKRIIKGASETTTFYAGNYIYEKTTSSGPVTLKCFSQPEGYVDVTGSAFKYIYQYKDHLGNVRLSYTKTATGLQIVEENHYYPFGVKHKGYNNAVSSLGNSTADKFKFNAKEYETELDVTEMDFRQYDAGLGRFYGLDLLAEATPWATPNHFALNNPVMASDPTGLLATWSDLIQLMNEFATGGGGGGAYDTMTITNTTAAGDGGWSFGISYSDNSMGTQYSLGTLYGSGSAIDGWANLPQVNIPSGTSTEAGGRIIQQHVYKNSPYYQGSTSVFSGSGQVVNSTYDKDVALGALYPNAGNLSTFAGNVLTMYDIGSKTIGNFVRGGGLGVASKSLAKTSSVFGVVGIAYNLKQNLDNKISNAEFAVDTTFGLIGVAASIVGIIATSPAWLTAATVGGVVSLGYFGIKTIYEVTTGQTVFTKPLNP